MRISCAAEKLLASQQGLISMKIASQSFTLIPRSVVEPESIYAVNSKTSLTLNSKIKLEFYSKSWLFEPR
jgi:hypothetical protein